jgi:citrate lyase beta subunit
MSRPIGSWPAVIQQAYLPTEKAAARARELLARSDGATALADGSFVDAAILRQARQLVELAERYGTRSEA